MMRIILKFEIAMRVHPLRRVILDIVINSMRFFHWHHVICDQVLLNLCFPSFRPSLWTDPPCQLIQISSISLCVRQQASTLPASTMDVSMACGRCVRGSDARLCRVRHTNSVPNSRKLGSLEYVPTIRLFKEYRSFVEIQSGFRPGILFQVSNQCCYVVSAIDSCWS
jgi:hypothetical protein